VIGANVQELTRLFGTPRLDVVEGDARKLQFSAAPACWTSISIRPRRDRHRARPMWMREGRAMRATWIAPPAWHPLRNAEQE
jgi:hypothetical protein